MKNPIRSLFRAALLVALLAATNAFCATITSTPAGGDWATGSTWLSGTPPSNSDNFQIQGSATVTAGNGLVYTGSNLHSDVAPSGTLNITSGTSFIMARLNNLTTLGSGTSFVNVTGTGSLMSVQRMVGGGSNLPSVSVSNGGVFVIRDTVAVLGYLNVGAAGEVRCGSTTLSTPGAVTLTGGKLVFSGGLTSTGSMSSWNTGTVVTNNLNGSSTATNYLFNAWKTNAGNTIALSSTTSARTLTIGAAVTSGTGSTAGNLAFNIYSSTNNDNDLFSFAAQNLRLDSPVHLQIGGVDLAGVSGDYIGKSYQLFNGTTTFANINPTIDATTLTIGGSQYSVTWGNSLSSNGTLTINDLTLIPEPSTGAMLAGGFWVLTLLRRRRA